MCGNGGGVGGVIIIGRVTVFSHSTPFRILWTKALSGIKNQLYVGVVYGIIISAVLDGEMVMELGEEEQQG